MDSFAFCVRPNPDYSQKREVLANTVNILFLSPQASQVLPTVHPAYSAPLLLSTHTKDTTITG